MATLTTKTASSLPVVTTLADTEYFVVLRTSGTLALITKANALKELINGETMVFAEDES